MATKKKAAKAAKKGKTKPKKPVSPSKITVRIRRSDDNSTG